MISFELNVKNLRLTDNSGEFSDFILECIIIKEGQLLKDKKSILLINNNFVKKFSYFPYI